jgi:hypothetical protein
MLTRERNDTNIFSNICDLLTMSLSNPSRKPEHQYEEHTTAIIERLLAFQLNHFQVRIVINKTIVIPIEK